MTKALWRPAWYELDQPLDVGAVDEYAFCATVPEDVRGVYELVFHNRLLVRDEPPVMRRARIVSIAHPVLGMIARVDTLGLDYTITLTDGSFVRVEAEEEPGTLYEVHGDRVERSARNIASWDIEVELVAAP